MVGTRRCASGVLNSGVTVRANSIQSPSMDRPINGHGHASNPALTLAALAVTVVLWSSAFVAIRAALESYNASHLAVFRFVVASVVIGALSIRRRMSLPSRRELFRVIAIGAIGITGYNLALNYGEMDVTAAAASFLVNTVPIITALIALVAGQERLSALGWLGSLVSFAGVSMVAIGEEGATNPSRGILIEQNVFQNDNAELKFFIWNRSRQIVTLRANRFTGIGSRLKGPGRVLR